MPKSKLAAIIVAILLPLTSIALGIRTGKPVIMAIGMLFFIVVTQRLYSRRPVPGPDQGV